MRKGIVISALILLVLTGCTNTEVKQELKQKDEKIVSLEAKIEADNMELEALRARNSELEKRMMRLQKIQKEKTSEINQLYYEKADIEAKLKKQQVDFNKMYEEKEREKEILKESLEILKKQKN